MLRHGPLTRSRLESTWGAVADESEVDIAPLIANGYIRREQRHDEVTYDLGVAFAPPCPPC